MSSSSNAARLVVPFLLSGLLAGLLAGAPGAQRVLHESAADFRGLGYREFGFAVARAGDLDGDGRDDYWMAGPDYEGESDGIVYLCSGADGEPTLLLAGAPGERFGPRAVGRLLLRENRSGEDDHARDNAGANRRVGPGRTRGSAPTTSAECRVGVRTTACHRYRWG